MFIGTVEKVAKFLHCGEPDRMKLASGPCGASSGGIFLCPVVLLSGSRPAALRRMNKICTLVVDDEAPARRRIKKLLSEFPEIEIVGECEDGLQAVKFIRERPPDLLFLDIQMPRLDGFGVISEVGAGKVIAVVFVTAYDQFALRAFESHALDYLLKPFHRERFHQALERAKTQITLARAGVLDDRLQSLLRDLKGENTYVTRLEIKSVGRTIFIPVEDIDWIEADSNYLWLHTGKERHLMRETLGAVENRLDPTEFTRIHRSTIVKIDHVREMRPLVSGDQLVILRDGTKLEMSRTYRDRALAVLRGHQAGRNK
jgi:two-component system LytT family response regulator